MYSRLLRGFSIVGMTAIVTAFAAGEAWAQSGSVTGRVSAASTGRAVASAQVFIQGLNIGSLTQANGRYLLVAVPVGTYTLEVTSIGYAPVSAQVTVTPDGVTETDFQLRAVALNLDEIVVTGTGAPTQRRRLGQTVESVTAEQIQMAPITNLADALVGRLPGARGLISGGQTGAGSAIVLRGTASISQRQNPIIYVDGVRLDNRRENASSVSTDRLMDINPQDIERVEIIKGAAAATLYGTEASSGVIQIFTKRGITGAPRYTFATDLQKLEFPRRFEENCAYVAADNDIICNYPYDNYEVLGYHQNYNLSVQGGTPSIGYYVSGRFMEEQNPSPNNTLENKSIRASFDFNNTERLTSSFDVSYVDRDLKTASPGWGDVFGNLMLGNPTRATPDNPDGAYQSTTQSLVTDQFQRSQNFLTNARLSFQFTDDIQSTLRVGYNFIDSRFDTFFPQGVVPSNQRGTRSVQDRRFATTTLDFTTTAQRQLTNRLLGTLTFGGQSFRETMTVDNSSVRQFASPTLETLSGGQEITGVSEGYTEVINAGAFVQGQVGLDDRLFLTGGVRFDGNSAFGEDADFIAYPKVGLSWVVSDYGFWNIGFVNELRLRGALGTSGLQPGAFDAQRTWNPNIDTNGGYLTPQNLGNPELKPEKSTELELAIEAGMYDGRLGLEVVYFNQRTTDALLPITPSPGSGFTSAQLRNLGELRSWGVEVMLEATLLQRDNLSLDLMVAPSYLKQWVEDMGGIPNFRLGSRRRWQSLYQGLWPGMHIAPVADPNQPYILAGGAGIDAVTQLRDIAANTLKTASGADSLVVIGRPQPNTTLDVASTLRWGNFTVQNIFEGAAGFVQSNETLHLRNALKSNRLMAELEYHLANPTENPAKREALIREYGSLHNGIISNTIFNGDYLRWAEVTVAYQLPESWAATFGSTSTTVSFGIKNVHVFSDYFSDFKRGWIDPGTRGIETTDAFLQNIDYLKTPAPRRFVFSLRTQF